MGTGVEQDFAAIEQAAEQYFEAHSAWEKGNLDVRFSDALRNYMPVFVAFTAKLETLNLSTPQGQYAKCKLQGLMKSHLKETREKMEQYQDKNLTLKEYYHSEAFSGLSTRPDAAERLGYVKELTFKRIYFSQILSADQATKAMEEECEGPLAQVAPKEISPADILSPEVVQQVATHAQRAVLTRR